MSKNAKHDKFMDLIKEMEEQISHIGEIYFEDNEDEINEMHKSLDDLRNHIEEARKNK